MTIEYVELSREELIPGVKILGEFTDVSNNAVQNKQFFVDGVLPTEQEITDKIESIKENIVFQSNPLNFYELTGADVRPILRYIVVVVRTYPGISLEALKTAVTTEYPDMFWNINQLVTHIKAYLEDKLGQTITFDEFKTYIITHKFKGVD